eukprot:scaffold159180_cov33-Tisochrysis_lutea.AAC.5
MEWRRFSGKEWCAGIDADAIAEGPEAINHAPAASRLLIIDGARSHDAVWDARFTQGLTRERGVRKAYASRAL